MIMKKVLIISSSPVEGGNSDRLCDEFKRGAQDSGHTVEKIFLRRSRIHFCSGCRLCDSGKILCTHKDDAVDIVRDMLAADVIVLSTPNYFHNMSAQMKTLIDRCISIYRELRDKEFYFIVTSSSPDRRDMYPVVNSLEEFTRLLSGSVIRGVIYGTGLPQSKCNLPEELLVESYNMGAGIV